MITIGVAGFISDRIILMVGRRPAILEPEQCLRPQRPILSLHNVGKIYEIQGVARIGALRGARMEVALRASFVCLLGASGCGKSNAAAHRRRF